MYETFYGLRERPFDLTPNPRFLLLTPSHRRALVNFDVGIGTHKGVIALIGEPGTGKTTVARALMSKRDATTRFVYLNQSVASAADLRHALVQAFKLPPGLETSNTELIRALTRCLLRIRERDQTAALLVDEAQSLSDEVLEEVRLLSNVETNEGKLLTLALIGQPRLAARLNEEMWAQLKQRIELRSALAPLELPETAAYIWSRVRTAGADAAQLFTADAIRLIHERSRGIARSISVIGENALMTGFAEGERPVTRRLVLQVCEELDFPERPQAATSAAGMPATAAPPAVLPPTAAPPAGPAPGPAVRAAAAGAPPQSLPIARERPGPRASTGRRWWFLSGAWLRS